MNAVVTRPRAAKAKPAPLVSPLESVVSRIQSALDLISMASTVSSTGAHLAMLLVGLETEMLPNALTILCTEPVSKVDVASAYEKLLIPLSVLHAAGVLADGLVMESTLQQAFGILDRAHSDMDSALVQHWPIPDQPPAQNGSTGDAADFERGMAVALDLLRAEQASRGQDVTCYRRHRDGRPQFRFWRAHIEKLVAEPTLIEGFDAVMSASGEDGQFVEVQELARVAPDEYFPGEVGVDRTAPASPDGAGPEEPSKASTTNDALGIELAAANTTTVMRVAAHDANSDAVWGVFKLNELANEAADAALRQADDAPDIDGLWAASSLYAQAIKLCGLVCANADNELVYAGLMLMEITKERVDTLAQAEIDKEAQA